MSIRKRFLLGFVLLLVAGLVAWAFRPQPVPVSLAVVERGALRVTIDEEGRTRVRERYRIGAPVAALASRIELEPGDPVKRGQVLVTLRPVPPPLLDTRSAAQARAAVAEAEAAYELARKELLRVRSLRNRGDVSESTLNEAQAAADRALAALRSARALLEYVGGDGSESPSSVPLTSPVEGQVLAVFHESAGTVAAGEDLIEVGDPGALEVAVDVLSSDAVRIRPQMPVLLERWGGDEVLQARVRTVEPSAFTKVSALGVEEQRVWVIADITSAPEEWAGLGDGYRVEAGFVLWQSDDVLKAPSSALFRDGEGWAAFVAEGDVAARRAVRVGHRAELEVEVLGGLSAGDRVITHPSRDVADGVRVAPR